MLKFLRKKKTAKKIWIGLALIIVPAFVFCGLGGALRSKRESGYVGRIFGNNISLLEYKDSLEAVKNNAIMRFGDKFDEIQKYINLKAQAWERLILIYEARRRKITASDREVIELIESSPFFQRKGRFDNRLYAEMLRYVFRTQPRIFEEEVRQNIILSKLFRSLTSDILVTDEQVREEYKKLNEEISFEYIEVRLADITGKLAPGNEEVRDFFEKNRILFKLPPSFNVEYVASGSGEAIKKVASLKRWSRDLKGAAAKAGLEVKETGKFYQSDSIPGIGWAPEIMQLIANLKVRQALQPIYFDKKYYLLVLKERKDSYIPKFEEAADKAKDIYLKIKSKELAQEKIRNYLEEVRRGRVDFEKVAKARGLKLAVARNVKYGGYIEGIGSSDPFWVASAALKKNEPSEVIETSSGFYIMRVKSRKEPDYKKLDAGRKEFTEKLLEQKKEEYFSQVVEDLKKKVQLF